MLTIRSTQDMLSSVPMLLGKAPTESVVALMVNGKRAGATLRVDLPKGELPPTWLDEFAGYLKVGEADKVSLIVYTSAPDEGDYPPYSFLSGILAGHIESSTGIGVVASSLVTPTYWLDYEEPDVKHPIEELSSTRFMAEAVAEGHIVSPAVRTVPAGPKHGFERTQAMSKIADMVNLTYEESGDISAEGEAVALAEWERHLTGTAELTPGTVVLLTAYAQAKNLRDRMLAVVIDRNCPDEFERIGQTCGGVLDASVTVDVPRFERGQELLDQMLGQVPGTYRVNLLCMAAMLHWHHGRGTDAAAYVAEALELSEGHRLARLISRLVNSGKLSPIASDRRHWTK